MIYVAWYRKHFEPEAIDKVFARYEDAENWLNKTAKSVKFKGIESFNSFEEMSKNY